MENTKINEDFLEEIRTYSWNKSIDFGYPKLDIIPEKLNHEYLFGIFSIDQSIKKWYASAALFNTEENFNQLESIGGYYDLSRRGLSPYPFKFCGAYISKMTLWGKLADIFHGDGRYHLNGNFNLNTLSDLAPYFKEFSRGFKNANEAFYEECINPYLPVGFDKYDVAQKIFELVTEPKILGYNWIGMRGFITTDGTKKLGIINAFENGEYDGYFYKAWSIIFSNNHLYAPLFQNHLNRLNVDNKIQLSLRHIALIHVYERNTITKENKNYVAQEHGYKSGEKLLQHFSEYSTVTNRKALPKHCTTTTLKNKINLMEDVIQILSAEHKQRAIDEVNILKLGFKNQDY